MKINKLFIYICIFVLGAVLFSSCDKDDKDVNEIIVDKETLNLYIGDKGLITVNGVPSNDINTSLFEWSSNNEEIATVTDFGVVLAIGEGETDITVKYGDLPSKTVHVVVTDPIILPVEVASWRFDDPADILKATLGNPLTLGANTGTPSISKYPSVEGSKRYEGDKAIRVEKGYYLIADHGIQPKSGEGMVNEYTVMIDFRIPALDGWRAFLQTSSKNDDAELFCKTSGVFGVGSTGYTTDPVIKGGEWQRIVASYKLGDDGWIKYFVDGTEVLTRTDMGSFPKNDRFAMESVLLLFADDDGEDGLIDVSEVIIWDVALDSDQAKKAMRVIGKDR